MHGNFSKITVASYSNENGLFCTHPLSVAPLFIWWKERGKQEEEPFDTVFFDTDMILILPRSESSILILY